MNYPEFFEQVESITLFDPLSEFLGSFSDGRIVFTYLDIVKAAGHSCPTVAGAYLMCLHGLKELYPEQLSVRGQIRIEFKEDLLDGVVGVMANVFTHITGATHKSGFKGINGLFIRHSLMAFNSQITSAVRMIRTDNQDCIELIYNPSLIPASQEQQELIKLILLHQATAEQREHFGHLWQDRVAKILTSPVLENGILSVNRKP